MEIVKTHLPVNKGERYTELDALRGLSVIAVILFHYTLFHDEVFNVISEVRKYFIYGSLAVHLFFIISGFVIFMTLERSKAKLDFIISRFSRLYPVYWCCIFITLIFTYVIPGPLVIKFSAKEVLINLTMLQEFVKTKPIDPVYWTLKVELVFYILMYVMFVSGILKKFNFVCILWISMSVISHFLEFPLKRYFNTLFILEYSPLFVAGMNFFLLKKGRGNILSHLLIAITFIVEAMWLYDQKNRGLIAIFIMLIVYIIFYLFVHKRLSFLNNKLLLYLGNISYSLYLLHNVIGYCIINSLRSITNNQILTVFIPFAVTVAISAFVTQVVEKPAIKLIRDLYVKHKTSKEGEKEVIVH